MAMRPRPLLAAALLLVVPGCRHAPRAVTVRFRPGQPLARFDPRDALGAGIDGHEKGEVDRMLSPGNVRAMLSAGLPHLAYRLRTELAGEVWHWNPRGTWSDPLHRRGYWVSDATPAEPIRLSYGYRLPRRGNTIDQANNDGYSRLADGDTASFWKSNPCLDAHFSGEVRPQWVAADLGRTQPVSAVQLLWGTPRALDYEVQYAGADLDADHLNAPGVWSTFPRGTVRGRGGTEDLVEVAAAPVRARWIRVWMTRASGAAPPGSMDLRDSLGYTLREIYIGTVDAAGSFHDLVRHAPRAAAQTTIYVSSTDPWHRAEDLDPRIEQPGLDFVFRSGLTGGLPMLASAGLLYDTPENAVNLVRYAKARGYPVARLELGEEPEEQYAAPEDYGALYVQFADALHRAAPALELGGPSLVANPTVPPGEGNPARFAGRVLEYLRARGRLAGFAFFTFEWYPFDDVCAAAAPQLAAAGNLLAATLRNFAREGIPRTIPWLMTEYGFSAYGAETEVRIEGALFNADTVGRFLEEGGAETFLYGYEPNELLQDRPCTWGNNMMFLLEENGNAVPLATYYGARMLTREWADPAGGAHELYPTSPGGSRDRRVSAYALRRPDGEWSVLLVNKDPTRDRAVRLAVRDEAAGRTVAPAGSLRIAQFSGAQYAWHAAGQHGRPARVQPPAHWQVPAGPEARVKLPAYSLTVVRYRTEP